MGKKQGLILLAAILLVLTSANVYAASVSVKPGDYLLVTGDPPRINGYVPPDYTFDSVIVTDSGCIYTGLEPPYHGSSIVYDSRIAVYYNLHDNPGVVRLTQGKYFQGLRINILVPEGYQGDLMYNTYGNGTHLIMHLCLNNNCFPVVYKLPVSLVVQWTSIGGLGTGWFINGYGPSLGLRLDLTGVKVASVSGSCTSSSTPTTTSTTTANNIEEKGIIQGLTFNEQGKWMIGLGFAMLIIALLAVLASKK